jgi:hypothetical protein
MTRSALLAAALLVGSGVVVATPSFAQVQFGIGPDGPRVRVGPEPRTERRYIERRRYEDDRMTTGSVRGCRTVVTREEDDDGNVVTRRVRRCR